MLNLIALFEQVFFYKIAPLVLFIGALATIGLFIYAFFFMKTAKPIVPEKENKPTTTRRKREEVMPLLFEIRTGGRTFSKITSMIAGNYLLHPDDVRLAVDRAAGLVAPSPEFIYPNRLRPVRFSCFVEDVLGETGRHLTVHDDEFPPDRVKHLLLDEWTEVPA